MNQVSLMRSLSGGTLSITVRGSRGIQRSLACCGSLAALLTSLSELLHAHVVVGGWRGVFVFHVESCHTVWGGACDVLRQVLLQLVSVFNLLKAHLV